MSQPPTDPKPTVREVAKRAGVSVGTVSKALNQQLGISEEIRARVLEVAAELGYDRQNLRPSESRIGLTDIAQRAGVSVGSVSRALKNTTGVSTETRQRVLAAAEQLGYDTNNLRQPQLERIGVLIQRGLNALATNLFYAPVVHGIEMACRQRQLVMSYASISPNDDIAELIAYHQVDALLMVGYFEPEIIEKVIASEKILVLVDHVYGDLTSVNGDNFRGAWQAVSHLIQAGCRRIAFISGPPQHPSIKERLRGYRQALADAHLVHRADLEIYREPLELADGARVALHKLFKLSEPPDAVFAYNDETAAVVMQRCLEQGLRIPEDIAIVGFDDIASAAYLQPPLSTVRINKETLGIKGLELLLAKYHGEEIESIIVPIELVVRGSSLKERLE